jgi:hypothetical protein
MSPWQIRFDPYAIDYVPDEITEYTKLNQDPKFLSELEHLFDEVRPLWTRLKRLCEDQGEQAALTDCSDYDWFPEEYIRHLECNIGRSDFPESNIEELKREIDLHRLGRKVKVIIDDFCSRWPVQTSDLCLSLDVSEENPKLHMGTRSFGFGSGSPLGDLVLLAKREVNDSLRVEAACRLAEQHITSKFVFFPERWRGALEAFNDYRGDLGFQEAWRQLVVPYIIEWGADSGSVQVGEAISLLRRHIRSSVEVFLLGHSQDSGDLAKKLKAQQIIGHAKYTRGSVYVYAAEQEQPTLEEHLEFAELRLELLSKSSQQEIALLEAYSYYPKERSKLAQKLGISPTALRQRIKRIRSKLKG